MWHALGPLTGKGRKGRLGAAVTPARKEPPQTLTGRLDERGIAGAGLSEPKKFRQIVKDQRARGRRRSVGVDKAGGRGPPQSGEHAVRRRIYHPAVKRVVVK
jgi:hypothetical protein